MHDDVRALQDNVSELRAIVHKLEHNIIESVETIPAKSVEKMLTQIEVNGAVPVTMDKIEKYLDERFDNLTTLLNSKHDCNGINSDDHQSTSASSDALINNRYRWGNKLVRYVPEGFRFLGSDTKSMFRLWYLGNQLLGIDPYRHLKNEEWIDDIALKIDRSNVYRTAKVMESMEAIADQLYSDNNYIINNINIDNCDAIFDKCFNELISKLYENDKGALKRVGSKSYATIARKIYESNPNKRKRNRKSDETNYSDDDMSE